MLRDVRRSDPTYQNIIDSSVKVLGEHVHSQHDHFAFIVRERVAGPQAVRAAIRHQIELVERELAADLARLTDPDYWSTEDLRVLSNLIVTSMVGTAEAILTARPEAERAILEQARTQLRMLLVGALHWRSDDWAADRAGPAAQTGRAELRALLEVVLELLVELRRDSGRAPVELRSARAHRPPGRRSAPAAGTPGRARPHTARPTTANAHRMPSSEAVSRADPVADQRRSRGST